MIRPFENYVIILYWFQLRHLLINMVSVISMKRATECDNESLYHHIRSVILLVAFTFLMAALTCLFAYFFDQISGI